MLISQDRLICHHQKENFVKKHMNDLFTLLIWREIFNWQLLMKLQQHPHCYQSRIVGLHKKIRQKAHG